MCACYSPPRRFFLGGPLFPPLSLSPPPHDGGRHGRSIGRLRAGRQRGPAVGRGAFCIGVSIGSPPPFLVLSPHRFILSTHLLRCRALLPVPCGRGDGFQGRVWGGSATCSEGGSTPQSNSWLPPPPLSPPPSRTPPSSTPCWTWGRATCLPTGRRWVRQRVGGGGGRGGRRGGTKTNRASFLPRHRRPPQTPPPRPTRPPARLLLRRRPPRLRPQRAPPAGRVGGGRQPV